jgi:hypothetical protein
MLGRQRVALGSPLGREVASRKIGALLAGRLSHCAGLSVEVSRLMVACGAGQAWLRLMPLSS